MAKVTWTPGTLLSPLPPALISSGDMENPNVMTAAWTGIICSDPVITYVSLRPSRYTHELVSANREFVINVPTWRETEAVDTVGVKSGREGNKFTHTGLTPEACTKVKAPQVAECPISLECKVLEVRPFGTHDMFLAEVVAVNIDEKYIDEKGALDLEKAGLIAYAHGFYYTLGRKLGKFGFSVEKKKNKSPLALRTIIKADEKFGKEKKEEKFRKAVDETFIENGVEVIVKKTKFKKNEKKASEQRHFPKTTENKAGNRSARRSEKFTRKDNKNTNYEPHTYHKKSDGSFKKKQSAKY